MQPATATGISVPMEAQMLRAQFVGALAILAIFVFPNLAHANNCEDGYALCMSGCSDDRTAERCMQSCQAARGRCLKFGIFKMPAGFVLNQGVMEYIVGQNALGFAPPMKQ